MIVNLQINIAKLLTKIIEQIQWEHFIIPASAVFYRGYWYFKESNMKSDDFYLENDRG